MSPQSNVVQYRAPFIIHHTFMKGSNMTSEVEKVDQCRRSLIGAAAMTITAMDLALSSPAVASSKKSNLPVNSGQKIGAKSFEAIKQVDAGLLNIGYADVGPADGQSVILLHGWPYDIYTYVDVAPILASKGYRVIVPYLRGYGTTRFLASETPRNGQQSAFAVDIIALMDALKIEKAVVAGCDWGARTANILAALWPQRCKAMVSVSGYLIGNPQAGKLPLPPKAELQWWYQYYFATERGRAGYEKYKGDFAKLIWQLASPKWKFEEAIFNRSAEAFSNPDHVEIVVQNYRWRLGLVEGAAQYDDLEKRLAKAPVITIPTITLEGDANGAPHPEPSAYAQKFSGPYRHRLVTGGIGHNLPQESPQAFADAIMDINEVA